MKAKEAIEILEGGIKDLLSSDGWKAYLSIQSKFHNYSWRNCMLIKMQCANATRVTSLRSWNQLGRFVCKGQKAIWILAPVFTGKREAEDEDERSQNPVYFKAVPVFDVSQTDGEPLPSAPALALEGDEDAGLFDRLANLAVSWGLQVNRKSLPDGCWGYLSFSEKRIVIRSEASPLQAAKTLAHELGHHLMHQGIDYHAVRPTAELEAESVSFVVLHHHGLDAGDYSFGYIAGWARDGAIKTLKESGGMIQRAAHKIIEGLEVAAEKESEKELVAA